MKQIKKKMFIWNMFAIILYFIAIAWNIKSGGMYNLDIGIGGLVLGTIKLLEEFLN